MLPQLTHRHLGASREGANRYVEARAMTIAMISIGQGRMKPTIFKALLSDKKSTTAGIAAISNRAMIANRIPDTVIPNATASNLNVLRFSDSSYVILSASMTVTVPALALHRAIRRLIRRLMPSLEELELTRDLR